MKFCFLCGKKTENLIKGYCQECYAKKFKLIEVPENITITSCPRCNRKFEKNRWKETDVSDIARDNIKIIGNDVSIAVEVEDKTIILTARGYLEGSKEMKEEKYEIRMKVIKNICPVCGKESGKYYESTVQVRGDITKEDFQSIDNITFKRGGFYRLREVKGGYDLLVCSKDLANKIADYIVKKYRIDRKKSFHLVTKKDGRDLYRDTILLRLG
jgi:nonsense-mediated mRNA decay protein 3